MPKLTASRQQLAQMALWPKASVSALPAAAPAAKKTITLK